MTAKPKRKAKAAEPAPLDLEAWGQCCQIWDRMTGRTRAWRPDAGDGRAIAEAMARQGAAKIVARFEAASRDHWCRSLAAGRDARTGADARPLPMTALTRDGTDLVTGLDRAAEQAALDASPVGPGGASVASQAPDPGEDTPARRERRRRLPEALELWARVTGALADGDAAVQAAAVGYEAPIRLALDSMAGHVRGMVRGGRLPEQIRRAAGLMTPEQAARAIVVQMVAAAGVRS